MYWFPQKRNHRTWVYPNFDYMQGQMFYDKPGAGKYGDPKNPALIEWYLKPKFSKDPHPDACLSSTAGAAKLKQTKGDDGKRSDKNALATQVGSMSDEEDFANLPDSSTTETRFSHRACAGDVADNVEYREFRVCGGTLHVPKSSHHLWWDVCPAADIKLKDRSRENKCVLIPVFLMSRGRARCKRCRGEVCSYLFCGATSIYHNHHFTIRLLTPSFAASAAAFNPQRRNDNDASQRRELQLWEARSQSRHALQVCMCMFRRGVCVLSGCVCVCTPISTWICYY